MGLPHSGSLSDIVLLTCAELNLTTQMQACSIKLLARLKVDAVAIRSTRQGMGSFARSYIPSAAPYEVRCEGFRSNRTEWLERHRQGADART